MTKARETARLLSSDVFTVSGTPANVGVGSTTPLTKLNVGGIISADGLNIAGVVTASSFVGDVTGDATGLSGTPNLNVGIVTASSFVGDLTGDATGLSGTPNLNVGIVTASSFVGDLTGIALTATSANSLATNATGTNLTLSGNLTVNGTQTIINTQTLDIADKTIGIGSTSTPSGSLKSIWWSPRCTWSPGMLLRLSCNVLNENIV